MNQAKTEKTSLPAWEARGSWGDPLPIKFLQEITQQLLFCGGACHARCHARCHGALSSGCSRVSLRVIKPQNPTKFHKITYKRLLLAMCPILTTGTSGKQAMQHPNKCSNTCPHQLVQL